MEEKKNLEIISGDGSELNISPVHDHLNVAKPKSATEKPTNIIIPKERTEASKNKKNKHNDKKNSKKEEH